MSSDKLAVLVDGSSFVYRAFYALPQLTREDGRPVGAIYGFSSMLMGLLDKHEADLFFVVLDSGKKTFRSEIYSEYKANRKAMPDELRSQLPMIKEVCDAFGIPSVKQNGYEADDLIATYSTRLVKNGFSVRIVSPDKDLTQLITEDISLFDPMKSKIVKAEDVKEKFGVLPTQMTFFQALVGDATDNVPGVEGVGPVTAAKLIQKFSSLDELFLKIDQVESKKIREKLQNHQKEAELSLKLVTLVKDIEVEDDIESSCVHFDYDRARNFLLENNFDSLLRRLDKKINSVQQKKRKFLKITSEQELKNFFELAREKRFSFFSASNAVNQSIIAICNNSTVAYCFYSLNPSDDMFRENEGEILLEDIQACLVPYLKNSEFLKIGLSQSLKCLEGLEINAYEDIGLMAYLLYGPPGKFVGDIFQDRDDAICKLQFVNITEVDQVCKIAEMIQDSYDYMLERLQKDELLKIYREIDLPLTKILKNMEENGIIISKSHLNKLADIFATKIKELEKEIFSAVGMTFNLSSVKQLGNVLFEKLKLPTPRKRALDTETLEELSAHSPVPGMIIEWRKFSKLLSTYTTSLCNLVNPKTGRVHTSFNMTSTLTGRLSSSNPNLQNIPTRSEYGKLIKNAFISQEGYSLVSCDYSQIELRILAHIADIEFFKDAFSTNMDIHTATASSIFDVPRTEVTNELRGKAKTINFGIIYGMSGFRLGNILGIPASQAKKYINAYFEKIPEFTEFREKTLEFARKYGYVQTLIGRRCYIRDIHSTNYQLRSFSERQALNAVIQGSAADIVKIAMIKVYPETENLNSKMLLQVHDELVFETLDESVERALKILPKIMENAMQLSVPLLVHSKFGKYLS